MGKGWGRSGPGYWWGGPRLLSGLVFALLAFQTGPMPRPSESCSVPPGLFSGPHKTALGCLGSAAGGQEKLLPIRMAGVHVANRQAESISEDQQAGMWRANEAEDPYFTGTVLPLAGAFGEEAAEWVASRPRNLLPPPQMVDRKWEGALPPVEAAMLADAEDGRLDTHSLFRAALIAGGTIQPEQLQQYETRFQSWLKQLQEQPISNEAPVERAERIFRFMHERILTGGYELRASDLAGTLQTGRYNCVSASLLYHCLLEPFGIEAYGVELPGHARTRLRIGEHVLDVETTCPRWFDLVRGAKGVSPQTVPAASSASGALPKEGQKSLYENQSDQGAVGQNGPDLSHASSARQISSLGLVATIYYNRGVDLLSEGKYAEALAANAKALRLDPGHPTAWGNFLATMNNWAVSLGRAGQYEEAAELLKQGLALAPSYEPFQANFLHVLCQWKAALCQQRRFAEAWDLLARSASMVPPSYRGAFRKVQLELAKDWTHLYLAEGDQNQAVRLWQEVRHRLGRGEDVLEAEQAALQGGLCWQPPPLPMPTEHPEGKNAAVSTTAPEEVR